MKPSLSLKKSYMAVVVLAVLLLIAASMNAVQAYFTTYVTASGEKTVVLDDRIETYEEVKGLEKTIGIRNTGKYDCFGRVLVIAPDGYTVTKISGNEWAQAEDGYWYYNRIIPAGETSADLLVISIGGIPADQPLNFDVVVIEEAIPVVYDANGNPDWSLYANEGGAEA